MDNLQRRLHLCSLSDDELDAYAERVERSLRSGLDRAPGREFDQMMLEKVAILVERTLRKWEGWVY